MVIQGWCRCRAHAEVQICRYGGSAVLSMVGAKVQQRSTGAGAAIVQVQRCREVHRYGGIEVAQSI